jgi:predicted aspartyl protease
VARADRVGFLAQRNLVAVQATLNSTVEVALLVDTGAEQMVISRRVATLLGLNQPLRTQTLVGVGQTLSVPVVRLNRVQVGSSVAFATNLAAAVYDLPPLFRVDGLLGLNFLNKFRTTFEFDTRTLVVRPFPARQGGLKR